MHHHSTSPRRVLRRLALGACLLGAAALGLGTRSEAQARVGPPAQDKGGAKTYATYCSACHQANGQGVAGMFPPVAGSEWVTGDAATLIRILLHGVEGKIEVAGETYAGHMPPWGGAIKDPEMAALATYLRSSWGNKAEPVSTATVAELRKAHASRKKPWTAPELKAAAAEK